MQALPRKKVRAASVCLSHSVGGRALGIKKEGVSKINYLIHSFYI